MSDIPEVRNYNGGDGPRRANVCGCVSASIRRGYCDKHYAELRKLENPSGVRPTAADLFWAKVDVKGPNDCWRWLNQHDRGGYGKVSVTRDGRRTTAMAHRIAYEQLVGPIPPGMQLDHVRARGCVHRDCVNPAHLEPVTSRENLRRSPTASTLNAQKTHCLKGHPFDLDLQFGKKRKRRCSICTTEYQRNYMRAKRAKGEAA